MRERCSPATGVFGSGCDCPGRLRLLSSSRHCLAKPRNAADGPLVVSRPWQRIGVAAVECGLIAEIGQSWGWDLHHPHNRRPQDVVALAQLSERVGLDLVTFQDHPYQPGYLDTWTLLSWVAAQTQTISVSGNVLNLPLRLPTVLARAVASLDLLSGGRVELGLGGGGFWDAIEAMGGPRRSPRETVEALSEAIDVIRAIWDEQPGGVFFDGKHYRVHGAKRGTAPAHDISIWVGAYRPRMLRLVGTKGDGWLPSTSYLKPGDLERGNRIIDDAAQAAGRDPRKIRRLLNFSPADVDSGRLFEYGIENGVSAFILWADDSDSIAQFGEVAQQVREATQS